MQFKAKGPGRGEEGGEQKTNLGEKKLDANRKGECFEDTVSSHPATGMSYLPEYPSRSPTW